MAKHEDMNAKEPATAEEVLAMHKILRSDPNRYLKIVSGWIDQNPNNANAHYERHMGWMRIGEPHRALADLDRAIELDADPVTYLCRGKVHRHLGRYQDALDDFQRGEALDPKEWNEDSFGPLYQADTHARLGHESEALAYCARLPDAFWTPGLDGAPSGNKQEVAAALQVIAARARSGPAS